MNLLSHHDLGALPPARRNSLAAKYVYDCIAPHGQRAVRNVATQLKLLATGTCHFPVSTNEGDEHPDNSYVVSPRNTYSGYARYEVGRLPQRWLAWPLRLLVDAMGRQMAAARMDRVVTVNNWLLSTNVYPPGWNGEDLAQMTELLVENHPRHALCWRSLNRFSNAPLIARLEALGYLPVPSRQVWLFDGRGGIQSPYLRCQDTRRDAGLRRRMPYELVPGDALPQADFERLEHLYNKLYLAKYCELNPQFTAEWLRCGQRDGWLRLQVLRHPEGRIDGVLGWVGNDQVMTTPIVGYDTALPQKLGLYRLIAQVSLQEAAQRRMLLNLSAGAAHFKRMRGGQPEIEYSMVYVRHLDAATRRTWALLSRLLQGVGVPLMRRYRL